MKKREILNKITSKKIKIIILNLTYFIPFIFYFKALGAEGLVPSGDDPLGWCDLFLMIQTIINFLLYDIAIPFAVLAIAYAGFIYLFSGGEKNDIEKAKNIFRQVFTGLLIAFAAWLMVDFIINWLAPDFGAKTGSTWYQLQCD